ARRDRRKGISRLSSGHLCEAAHGSPRPFWRCLMQLVVGLANPGDQYSGNRHNIGFMAVDAIARAHNFPPFRQKFSGLISEGTIDGQRVLLLKPQTYMNNSGDSVVQATKFYKLPNEAVTVLYDELDLAP